MVQNKTTINDPAVLGSSVMVKVRMPVDLLEDLHKVEDAQDLTNGEMILGILLEHVYQKKLLILSSKLDQLSKKKGISPKKLWNDLEKQLLADIKRGKV